jgi:hypothetical protein
VGKSIPRSHRECKVTVGLVMLVSPILEVQDMGETIEIVALVP